jgi:hypothetical protein
MASDDVTSGLADATSNGATTRNESAGGTAPRIELVRVSDPEHMNLLGLLLQGFVAQQLQSPKLARKALRTRGAFGIQAGQMAITLTFGPDGVVVSKNFAPKTRARIIGSMEEMIALVAGGGTIAAIIAVLEGRLKVRGNPFALLALLPIMVGKVKPPPALPASTGAKA